MPPEKPSADPDRNRRPRSLGSFLLFLFVLIVVLVYFGSDSITKNEELTQDQYLYHLLTGRIVSQEFRGTESGATQIEGMFRREADGAAEAVGFETSFADVQDREEEFRELKAIQVERSVAPADLLAAIESSWYRPVLLRSITRREDRVRADAPAPATQSRSGTDDAAETSVQSALAARSEVAITEHLYVQVMAASKAAFRSAESRQPPFFLPDSPRHVWLEVDLPAEPLAAAPREGASANLVGDLVGAFASAGAAIDRSSFDVTANAGSSFSSSDGLFSTILVFYGPWILIFAVFLIVLRQMRGQGGAGGVMSFGRSRAQLYTKENRTNITFDDVAGAEEAKAEVREIVEFLKNPGRFTRIGGRIPRGVLLVGPPGCGKTLLAKAIAGEAEVPFFSISGSDFVEMFVGVGASRVRDLFKQARENSPCIIFLDEIDAVGRRRGSGMGGGHDEREQTLNAILVEMDGFGTDEGIIVVAATNRPDVLDPALLRPGRFDREVTIDLPDMEGRRAILAVHLKRVKHSSDVDVEVLARSSPGYSGADLAAIVNEAAIMAVLAKRDEIWMEDLEEARDKVRYGRQKRSRKIEEEDKKITAYHEAGHAVVAAVLEDVDPPHKVTIVPRGRALGATMVLPEKESYHMQRKRLLGQLSVLFGGRVAEQEFCGDISAGASDDIRRATELARAMVTELGMSDKIGPINYADRQGSDFLGTELLRGKTHSEDKANQIDDEVHRIISEAYSRTEELLRSHRSEVEALTSALLELETINGDEVVQLLGGKTIDELRRAREKAREVAKAKTGPPRPTRQTDDQPRAGELPGEPGLYPA